MRIKCTSAIGLYWSTEYQTHVNNWETNVSVITGRLAVMKEHRIPCVDWHFAVALRIRNTLPSCWYVRPRHITSMIDNYLYKHAKSYNKYSLLFLSLFVLIGVVLIEIATGKFWNKKIKFSVSLTTFVKLEKALPFFFKKR